MAVAVTVYFGTVLYFFITPGTIRTTTTTNLPTGNDYGDSSGAALAPCSTTSRIRIRSNTISTQPKQTILHETQDLDFLCHDPAISFLQVLDPPPKVSRPINTNSSTNSNTSKANTNKILCLVLTQDSNHDTRLDAILETWGSKCDGGLIAASNVTDPSRHAYNIHSETGYWGIWDKLMQTLRMIVEDDNNNTAANTVEVEDDWEWILKADDDTYVIMENLQSFLWNQTTRGTMDDNDSHYYDPNVPVIYGRRMPWPFLLELKSFGGWFETPNDKLFGERFYAKFRPGKKERLVYAHGGPGYVMNRAYVHRLVHAYFHAPPGNSVQGRVSEDLANAVTMMYYNSNDDTNNNSRVTASNSTFTPHSTMDLIENKERSHPESPRTMYSNPKWLPWIQENIQNRGTGSDCCSSTSISYHHVNHREMRLLHYQLYTCRSVGGRRSSTQP